MLPIQDYRRVFDVLDWDKSGEIGYKEFSMLNADKRNIFAYI